MDAFTYKYMLSQSVFYQVLNAVGDYVFKKMSFKRIGTEKQIWTSSFYGYERIS